MRKLMTLSALLLITMTSYVNAQNTDAIKVETEKSEDTFALVDKSAQPAVARSPWGFPKDEGMKQAVGKRFIVVKIL